MLLRKKFFILNDDITEALDGNEILEVLIYEQVSLVEVLARMAEERNNNFFFVMNKIVPHCML